MARETAPPRNLEDPAEGPTTEAAHGRDADSPSEVPPRGWIDVLWRAAKKFSADRLMMVGASVAFYVLLAIFPALAALVSLYGIFTDPAAVAERITNLGDVLPADAINILRDQVNRIAGQPSGSLSFGFFLGLGVSLWTANNGTKALFYALNVVYQQRETRGFFKLSFISLCFTLAMIAVLLLALVGIVAVPIILGFVGLETWGSRLIDLLRWPILFVLIALAVAMIYRFGPDRKPAKWRWISWGSTLATVCWMIGSLGFSWYVANFASYNEVYGSLGAVIAFMVWIWLSAIIVLLGAEVDAELEHQTAKDSTVRPEKPMGRRGATMADTLGEIRR